VRDVHDLVIRGGTVVDGSGARPRTADVAIDGGIVSEVGRVDGSARQTMSADGLLVTPGFVDIHTHFDGQATWDPHLTPSCWHGVTTAILGNCGVGFAPVRPDRRQWLIELMEGVEDIPGTALVEGIRWAWESFPEYLDALDAMPRALDIGAHLPHAAVRAYVMDERAHDAATDADLDAMDTLLRDALRAGALGFSTGRTAGHRDVRGEPVPGTYAAEDELRRLLSVMDEEGRGVLEVVPAGVSGELGGDAKDAMRGELDWILRSGEAFRRPITFLVMESRRDPDAWRGWFDEVREANARGADIRPQVASRCFGMLLGHQSNVNPWRHRPSYRALEGLPFEEKMRRLHDPEVRARVLAEPADPASGPPSVDQYVEHLFGQLFPLGDQLDYEPAREGSVAARAAATGQDPWAVTYDLMLGAEGRDFLLHPLLNYGRGNYDGLRDMLMDPLTVQGLGDGGAHCGIICDASMTTYLLSHWVRDRQRGERLPLEWAVHRLTADPAQLYGLHDRGLLRPGYRADVNVIDFDRLGLRHPERVDDLPAGAGRLVQRATGYTATIVAGEVVVDDGDVTDARPGRLVRGPQAAPPA
jgi:N-acyl-D-aspartate/D-glutamate deacylase